MAGLGETTARLARLKRSLAAGHAGPAGPQRMTASGFSPNPGGLQMLSYAPDDLAPGAPLVVVLHGCTQAGEAYAAGAGWLALADRHGFAVLAPEQSPGNNPNRCFNWFEPADIARGQGEAASIAAMVGQMIRRHDLDPHRVYVTGLSAGGAMAAVMLAAYPDLFAGGSIIAGVPFGLAGDVREALSAMHGGTVPSAPELAALVRHAGPKQAKPPRLVIWHGSADHTVAPVNAKLMAQQWAGAHRLPPEPDEVDVLPGRSRSTWRSDSGEALVECNLIAGLGHGAPLSTAGPEGVGAAGPYLLEVGLSSSLESLRFWGLAEAAAPGTEPRLAPSEPELRPWTRPEPAPSAAPDLGRQVMASVTDHVPPQVSDTIARALRAAGLLH